MEEARQLSHIAWRQFALILEHLINGRFRMTQKGGQHGAGQMPLGQLCIKPRRVKEKRHEKFPPNR